MQRLLNYSQLWVIDTYIQNLNFLRKKIVVQSILIEVSTSYSDNC